MDTNIKKIIKKSEAENVSDSYLAHAVELLNLQGKTIPILNIHQKFQTEPLPYDSIFLIILVSGINLIAISVDKLEGYYEVTVQLFKEIGG